MGLFKKRGTDLPELPELPDLPPAPSLREFEDRSKKELGLPPAPKDFSSQSFSQLPQYPKNSFAEKFSQNAIKEAVSGGKEEQEFEDFELPPLKKIPIRKSYTQEIPIQKIPITREIPAEFQEASAKIKSKQPIFIRLDKFQEALRTFENAKTKFTEIEHTLKEIKKVKEQEEQELLLWEQEIQKIKNQIEKIDNDVFSKVE